MILKIYQLITFLIGPLIDLYLLKRKNIGKEDETRFSERLGKPSLPRPKGTLIWVHAASVGETISVLPIINKISPLFEDLTILLTTGTVSSAKLVESRLPDNAFHQYVPIDKIGSVKKFLKHWKPDLALWVESEFWPNLTTQAAKTCPLILVNGRISDDSFKQWQRYLPFGKDIFSGFSLCLPQSNQDATRLELLGAENVKYVGNIKFDAPPLPSDPKKMGELIGHISDRNIWLAASTHPGEEAIAASIHLDLKEHHPDLLTIIVPRHPKRAGEIKEEIEKLNLNIALRSKNEQVTPDTDIYLADTMGELGIFYRVTPIVFIGGSLVNHGGQNPLESARLNCSIIYGPYMDNFLEVVGELEKSNAAIKIKDRNELKHSIEELISNQEKQEKLAQKSLELVNEKSGVLDEFVKEILPFIDKIAKRKNETKAA